MTATLTAARSAHLPSSIDWHGWGQMFTDVEVWRPVVEHICRETALAPGIEIEAGYPGTCAVFLADSRAVVKLFPPLVARDFLIEREMYRLLQDRLRPMPRMLAEGVYRDRIDWPFLVLEYRAGRPIRELYGQIEPENKRMLAAEIGLAIREIHSTPTASLNGFEVDPRNWRERIVARRAGCLNALRQAAALPEAVLREVERFLESMELGSADPWLVLVNADLTEDHLLLCKEHGMWQVSALIDWADAEVNSREYEWIALWFGLCNRDSEMFRHILEAYDPGLRVDDAYLRLLLANTFLHQFGAQIIIDVLQRDGSPPVRTLEQLKQVLWPL